MTSIDTMTRRAGSMLARIEDQRKPRRVLPLPTVYLDSAGNDWPGYADSNQTATRQARARGISVKTYIDLDPGEDGIEP